MLNFFMVFSGIFKGPGMAGKVDGPVWQAVAAMPGMSPINEGEVDGCKFLHLWYNLFSGKIMTTEVEKMDFEISLDPFLGNFLPISSNCKKTSFGVRLRAIMNNSIINNAVYCNAKKT